MNQESQTDSKNQQKQSVNAEEPDGEIDGKDQETGSSQQPSKDILKQINNASRLKVCVDVPTIV